MIGNIDSQDDWDATELCLLLGIMPRQGTDSRAFLDGARVGYQVGLRAELTRTHQQAKAELHRALAVRPGTPDDLRDGYRRMAES